ncbi:acyltransferase family protein [Ornithinimicrobium pekingense]|uniref:Acyltransferase n=1 Tax=Ornithinimicrobium pekingense TaxID=384677 RepID=A0ABQ2F7J8_9MICO|nr:acyltransferase family protein [Ornithinimicrobium pekingense]GGK61582.1 acyltransferase [Ornithinimicrobium pekingense]
MSTVGPVSVPTGTRGDLVTGGRHRVDGPPVPAALEPQPRRQGLHGLRGVAVALVVAFHLFGAGRVSGGIDVFVAISGFLFTGMIARRVVRDGGRFDLPAYLARLVRRLLPPILPVLAFVLVGTFTWMASSARVATWRETAAVLLYRENFELIDSQLGYDAAGVQTSPLQHFWSLSVQGQFYLLWPVVILAGYWLARWRGWDARRVVALAVVAVALASFAFAVHLRSLDPQAAYLHTGARLWQLALPGLLALTVAHRRIPVPVRVAMGWAGVALIVSCGFVLDGAALFPGPWAMWPVAGLVLFLLADDTGARGSADVVLSSRPAHRLGDISYALYLWHWPLLIAALRLTDRPAGDLALSTAVLVTSVALAWLTWRWVERPAGDARRWPAPRGTTLAGVAALVVPAVLLTGAAALQESRHDQRLESLQVALSGTGWDGRVDSHPGALALTPGWGPVPDAPLLLPPELAAQDKPPHDAQGCWQSAKDRPENAEVLVCPEPPGMEVEDPGATVVVTGGSHGAMWEPAWRVLAQEHRWRVLVMVKAGCQLTTNVGQHPEQTDVLPSASCQEWNRRALAELDRIDPDVVFTIATTTAGAQETEKASRGFVEAWEALDELGLDVVAVRDIHRMAEHVPDCVEEHMEEPAACDTPRVPGPSPMTEAMVPGNVRLIDLVDRVCTARVCPAVVGNIIAYSDHSHLSASFSATLATALDAELRRAAPQLYGR